jgi:murein L,D-transpeptidase YcbB/YkuD
MFAAGPVEDQPSPDETGIERAMAQHIRASLTAPGASSEPLPAADRLRDSLVSAYVPGDFGPLWFDAAQPTQAALQVLDALDRAAEWGLRAEDYRAAELRAQVDRVIAISRPASESADDVRRDPARSGSTRTDPRLDRAWAEGVARVDVGMSLALSRLLGHIAGGRIDPGSLGIELGPAAASLPLPELLNLARLGRVRDAMARAEPASPVYQRLKTALARTRGLLSAPELPPLELPGKLSPGDDSESLPSLLARLRLWGDLDSGLADTTRYDGAVVDGVRRFQARHGLDPDGVIGAATVAALAVPVEERVVQLELALERHRWLTRLPPGRLILVNIAAFEAQAFRAFPGADSDLVMPIVVGDADKTPTPQFVGKVETVVFRPFWYPPRSILTQEVLPALRKDAEYFVRNGFEIVATERDDAEALPPTPDRVVDVAAGALRVRQRPGALNALGSVKFIFPNRHSVYMHDTPARSLFARARRDFSHGCIRLGRPLDLAEFVLQGTRGWDAARALDASRGESTLNVPVRDDIRVVVFYMTADVTPEGRARFFPDIYSIDPALLARLAWLDR